MAPPASPRQDTAEKIVADADAAAQEVLASAQTKADAKLAALAVSVVGKGSSLPLAP